MKCKCNVCGAIYEDVDLHAMGFDDWDECPECGEIDSFEVIEE